MDTITDVSRAGFSAEQIFSATQSGAKTLLEVQKELLDVYEEAAQAWLARVRSECDLWSELATRLSESRTLPDGLSACQHSFTERVKLATTDAQRLLDDGRKITSALTHSLSGARPKQASN